MKGRRYRSTAQVGNSLWDNLFSKGLQVEQGLHYRDTMSMNSPEMPYAI